MHAALGKFVPMHFRHAELLTVLDTVGGRWRPDAIVINILVR
jgi:hypothetical protein